MIKVLIADDQKLLRESLKTIIETDREIQVTGCASNGQEAFELCGKALPDVVLMDVRMPDCDGVEGTRLIKEKYAGVKIVMLTTFEDEKNMAEALESGADGYIFKDVTPEELIRVIKNAAEGFLVFSRKTERILLRSFTSREGGREGADNRSRENTGRGPQALLKPGEMEILQLIAEGKSNRAIAETVFLSEGRVKNIVSEILDKLGLKDRYELLSYAYKNNMIK
jgi:DNA-binding NarL/FixJ family response regulator